MLMQRMAGRGGGGTPDQSLQLGGPTFTPSKTTTAPDTSTNGDPASVRALNNLLHQGQRAPGNGTNK